MLSLAMGSNFQPQASHFLPSSLVDQLYAKKMYLCSSLTKSNLASPNIHPNVLNSFHRTAIHGRSHGTLSQALPPPNGASRHFTIEPLPPAAPRFSPIRQARSQKFFRAEEVSWYFGTLINISSKTKEKEGPAELETTF